MPTGPAATFSGRRLDPIYNADDAMASMLAVSLPASVTYDRGTVLGEISATPGVYKAYAAASTDGSQNPSVILQYPVATDATGNLINVNEWAGAIRYNTPVFTRGDFRTQELIGLDQNAVTKMAGGLSEGSLTVGVFKF